MARLISITTEHCGVLAVSECIKRKCEYPHFEGTTCRAEHQAEALYKAGYRKQSEVIDEFAKRLIDAFPEANPNHHSPCLYYDEYRYIIEELAEEMKGGAE